VRAIFLLLLIFLLPCQAQDYDLVIRGGTVMDPASGLNAVRDVGIRAGSIAAISETPLTGKDTLDAKGLIVAPGFIDLHQHAQDMESYKLKVRDGVTSALELEVGAADIDAWYAEREGKLPVNFGVSVGHIPVRMRVMGDFPGFLPNSKGKAATVEANAEQIAEMKARIAAGLDAGALGVGFGVRYTPAATNWEILEMFRVAGQYKAPCYVHLRGRAAAGNGGAVRGLEEVLAASMLSGAPLHVVHIQSTGAGVTPQLLQMVGEAQARGYDVTAECYPYTAGMTDIRAAMFDEGWQIEYGLDYKDLQWGATGERLTAESFAKYREMGGLVIIHSNPESIVTAAVKHPTTMIASDGLLGHPRNAGTFARILGFYAREQGELTLMEALRKVSLMPAQRLETRAPHLKNKGRVQVGADADLTLFNAAKVIDKATFQEASLPSEGIPHVIVGGTVVVRDGKLVDGVLPGKPVRAKP